MADQAERIILEAEDEVTPVVNKANAGLDSFEKKAESSHGKVIRITDQTRSSIQRLIASLEKQAEIYGKSGVDRLIAQRDSLLQRYAREPAAIDAITRSYERMIETQKRVDAEAALEKQARSVQTFGERVAQSIENPVQGAGSAVGSLLTKIGPLGVGLAAGATAIAGFAVATWEAVKSLGEYGVRVKDAELRTGLTAKEVGQFGFAARAVGEDISIFERLMRGLTGAIEDNGKEGEKARQWLTRFGVDIRAVRTGTEPTSEVLLQVAKGLEGLPPGFDRTRVAMDLFKRAGIEAIPVMDGLRERVDRAKQLGFGITETDVKKYEELNQKAVEFEMKWESAVRSVKAMLVDLASAFGWVLDKIASRPPTPTRTSQVEQQQHAARVSALEAQGVPALQSQMASLQGQMNQYKPGVTDWLKVGVAGVGAYFGLNLPYGKLSSNAQQYGQAASQLDYVKEALDALNNKPQPHPPLREPPTSTGDNGFEAAMRQARRELAGTSDDRFTAIAAERQEAINEALEKFKGKAGPLVELLKQVYDAKWLKEYNKEQERTSKELDVQSQRWEELKEKSAKASGAAFREDIAEGIKKLEEQSKAVAKLAAEWVKLRDTGEGQAVAHQKRMISITGDDPLAILKAQQALDLTEIQQKRQASLSNLSTNPLEAIEERVVAEKQAANAVGELRYQWEEKVAEVRKKADQEAQQMLDQQEKSIEKVAEKLYNTLFTKPKDFGKDLAKTIHQEVLKPVVEGVSGITANVLHPVIYGDDGKGGIAGIFKGLFGGGKTSDPVKVSTDQNTAATIQNTAHIAAMTAVLAGAMGVSAPPVPSATGMPGVSLPSISAPAVSIPTRTGGGGGGGSISGGGSGSVAVAVGPSFSDLANLPLNHDRIAQTLAMSAPVSQIGPNGSFGMAAIANLPMNQDRLSQMIQMAAGGKLQGPGGGSQILANLKSSVWSQKEFTSLQDSGSSDFVSGLGAVAKSPAVGAAGMMLAESGLLGSHQGSWSGVGMGAAGGAMIGFQMGGPLGALIGGVAGAGIGIGEKLAGIESPQKKAHDDIKNIYGVDIPQNSGTIKQVVSIAQSEFGNDIAVAVRSPKVRQLVMLYSEATGQKMPLSASTPYAGSLVESGGNLYQQASFQNNAWHSYQSDLPVLGGLGGSAYPTTPGPNTSTGTGSTYVSLNINGQPITADFVADQSLAAQNASYGRTQQAANLQVPGLMVAG